MPWSTLKWKVKVAQSCSTLCDPMDIVHGILQAGIPEWVAVLFSKGSSQPRDQTQGSSQPRDQTQVSHIAGGLFTSWATGKPKNIGVGSLSLLQGIFLTQELNRGLLHCSGFFTYWATREARENIQLSKTQISVHFVVRSHYCWIIAAI